MNFKMIGIILVITGSTLVGFYIASNYKNDLRALQQFMAVLEQMSCELKYKSSALPELCRFLASGSRGCIHAYFLQLAQQLESQAFNDAEACALAVLSRRRDIPPTTRITLSAFAKSLGRYSLDGQLRELEYVQQLCAEKLKELSSNMEFKTKHTQTLAICVGVAIVIILA